MKFLQKYIKWDTKKAIKYSIIFVSIVLIMFVLLPFIKIQISLASLNMKNISKIVYAEYEDVPFSSNIKLKKEFIHTENKEEIDEFIKKFKNGTIKLYKNNIESSKMLFIYLEDDRIVNAYVSDDMLGLKYGKYWLSVKEIDELIGKMKVVDIIEIKEITSND